MTGIGPMDRGLDRHPPDRRCRLQPLVGVRRRAEGGWSLRPTSRCAASSREGASSFHRISFTCHFAPSGEMPRRSAICGFVRPSRISSSTSNCRGVSTSGNLGLPRSPIMKILAGCAPNYPTRPPSSDGSPPPAGNHLTLATWRSSQHIIAYPERGERSATRECVIVSFVLRLCPC